MFPNMFHGKVHKQTKCVTFSQLLSRLRNSTRHGQIVLLSAHNSFQMFKMFTLCFPFYSYHNILLAIICLYNVH